MTVFDRIFWVWPEEREMKWTLGRIVKHVLEDWVIDPISDFLTLLANPDIEEDTRRQSTPLVESLYREWDQLRASDPEH